MSTKSFSVSVAKFAETIGGQLEEVALKVAFDLHARVVEKTPVGNPDLWKVPIKNYVGGTLRQNWLITSGAPATNTVERVDGYFPSKDYSSVIASFKPGDTIFIRNNIAYANRVEHGWSKQAPSGMLKLTVVEFQNAVRKVTREVFR